VLQITQPQLAFGTEDQDHPPGPRCARGCRRLARR